MIQHNRRDINSHLLKHANEMGHERVWLKDLNVQKTAFKSVADPG